MTGPSFDDFYREVRDRLLLQTYALTGDRATARRAVRDAFVAAAHHWSSVERAEDPEAVVREMAWGRAQRRHGARPWHRDKDVDEGVRATLDALASLSGTQRRVLVLAHLATVSLPALAREAGLAQETAEAQLQTATTRFALARDVPAAAVITTLEPLAGPLADVGWPRATIVRRSGTTRRRTHTLAGVLGVLALLAGTGVFVSDDAGLRPSLARAVDGVPLAGEADADGPQDAPAPADGGEPAELLPTSTLLTAEQVGRRLPGLGWSTAGTSDNSEGNGLVLPCQPERYLDPGGEAALVRQFRAAKQQAPVRPRAVQVTEVAGDRAAARAAVRSVVGWVGGCTDARTQLLASRTIAGIGDEAHQLVLRGWEAPVTTSVVQVARTGRVVTATSTTYAGEAPPDQAALARLQATAVDAACDVAGAGPCAGDPSLRDVPPPAVGEVPALISEVDLPPVSRVEDPWVGTEPVQARTNPAATGCDRASFAGSFEGATWQQGLTRSFLVPGADLPAEFGLTETMGSLPTTQARAFVQQVRDRLGGCSDDDLGTEVARVAGSATGDQSLDAWQLTTEVSDRRSLRFFMAVLRQGTSVAQVGFVPAPGVTMRDGAFVDLAERALERLAELPQRTDPSGGGRGGGNQAGDEDGDRGRPGRS